MRAMAFSVLLLTACASAPPYAHCGGDVACAMGSCFELTYTRSDGTTADGNVCTNECHADADCVDGGACVGFQHDASGRFFCVERCMQTSDCHTPLACTTLTADDGTTFGACLP